MASKSLLDTIGSDIKGIFSWLGSVQGQEVITTGEGIIEAVYPPATGIINIANNWLTEILKTQALATAAGAASGSDLQKAAMAINAATPQVIAFAEQNGFPVPTGAKLLAANNALVAFLNALDGKG